ncbi:hypothetical protein MGR01S_28150 [Meiothermus granaticius NBRC 107808]|uniref:Holin n=1 Tax=Meiothermus granaticius NBRC 107808 TaxID=1227551 RepID=A0A399FFL5_9DEIN|nr:hypothetical protein Mgrana_00067 [Meiothermus granaticius NBRC 107808]GEM88190.1 hypothetical protein MGR01S_28150 [Meiothermus granaticius NBRC 107808]
MNNAVPFWRSKGFWVAVTTIVVTGYNTLAPVLQLPDIPELVYAVLGALGLYARAVAQGPLSLGK